MTEKLAAARRVGLRRADLDAFAHRSSLERVDSVQTVQLAEDLWLQRTEGRFEVFRLDTEQGPFCFNVTRIKQALAEQAIEFWMFEADLTPALYESVLKHGGVEEERVDALRGKDLKRPGILTVWPDERSTLLDGNHRLVRRYRLGLPTFRYAAVDVRNLVPRFLIDERASCPAESI